MSGGFGFSQGNSTPSGADQGIAERIKSELGLLDARGTTRETLIYSAFSAGQDALPFSMTISHKRM